MRRRCNTSDASDFWLHDHVAWSGDGPGAFDRLAVSAFSTAAARGERMILVSDSPDPHQLAGLEDLAGLMERGALQLATIEDTYREILDPAAQLAIFEQQLDGALAAGHTGLCVVADNSRLVDGSDEQFAAWLAWEATTEWLQAHRPVTGVCYFDRQTVPSDRLADLAAIHPVLSTDFEKPSFQLFVDDDAVAVVCELDTSCAEQLRRVFSSLPKRPDLVLDFSGVEFIDHRALLILNEVAGAGDGLAVRGAKPIVQRIWRFLDVARPALEFS